MPVLEARFSKGLPHFPIAGPIIVPILMLLTFSPNIMDEMRPPSCGGLRPALSLPPLFPFFVLRTN